MDFKNLCNKIDVESIKAKLPHMPAMPAMPQIKLPKSIPKLKSRKIFSRSREDVRKGSPTNRGAGLAPTGLLPPPPPPADFIKRTPTRISTISSLMQQHITGSRRDVGGSRRDAPPRSDSLECDYDANTYRSADSIDDDYPSPPNMPRRTPSMRSTAYHTSPVKVQRNVNIDSPVNTTVATADASSANVKMSLTEKLQKGYKDLTEFRFKHLLAKKTIVRKDNIEVDYYVKHYNADRVTEQREEARRDREIAENYRFKFKESRQNTGHSNSVSPMDSPIAKERSTGKAAKSVSELSGDESGMETSPPKRPPGIAATRFAKVRNPPLRQSLQSLDSNLETDEHEEDEKAVALPNSSALWAIKENKNQAANAGDKEQQSTNSKRGYKERMRRLTNYMSSQEETDKEEGTTTGADVDKATVLSKIRKFGKREASKEEPDDGVEAKSKSQQSLNEKSTDNPLTTIKQNIKRFKSTMSLKRQPTPVAANDSDDETSPTKTKPKASISPQKTTKEKLVAHLNRFKSRDEPAENDSSPKKTESSTVSNNISPIRTAITNKLQTWKKSFKKKPNEQVEAGADTGTDGESSPEKQQPKRSSTLVKKLKYIRSRKNPSNSNDELDAGDTADEKDNKSPEKSSKSTSNFEEKFENVRQRTLKKVNDKMQKMKFFQKSQEQIPKDSETTAVPDNDNEAISNSTSPHIPTPTLRRRRGGIQSDYEHDSENEDDDIEEINNLQEHFSTTQKIHAVWTTKPILSDSTESEDNDTEYPRVLIHQDNSDLYESTLIIAVTSSAPPSPMPKITEILTTPPKGSPKGNQNVTKAIDWIPNREIISSFLEITPPRTRKTVVSNVVEGIAPTIRGHARKLSIDSNSDSDSWIPDTVRNKQISSNREDTRRTSGAGLNSIQENEEPWRVYSKQSKEMLYKSKSIDIFEANAKLGGVSCAFEDFDDELKNEPVMKIPSTINSTSDNESYGKDSSEEQDIADDDNSSRVTKIRVENVRDVGAKSPNLVTISVSNVESQRQQFGNSRESLDANFDENEEMYTDDDDDDDDDEEDDRPPSAAPSPPPTFSPPPPPLPARQPSIRLTQIQATETVATLATLATVLPQSASALPPLPTSKPPILPPPPPTQQPPKIPERTESMARISKPLVKTSSLRLAYTEQVKPGDIGKVNKLISRFEQPNGKEEQSESKAGRRPRVIRRTMMRDSSEDYTEDEEEAENYLLDKALEIAEINDNYNNRKRDVTPTPALCRQPDSFDIAEETLKRIQVVPARRTAPMPKQLPIQVNTPPILHENNNKIQEATPVELKKHTTNVKIKSNPTTDLSHINVPKISLDIDNNSKITQSRPSSEYGSPLEYPSSLIGSTETTPTPDRRQGQHHQELRTPGRRSRSKAAEDDQYYSFDSDEENSYYSISSTSSSRYVVEI